MPAGDNIGPGDQVTVTIAGVTNPGQRTYSDFAVSTTADAVVAVAPAYMIGPSVEFFPR